MAEMTSHLIIDIKSGHAFGVRLDKEGKCTAVQLLNNKLENFDGDLVGKFGPAAHDAFPFGKTTYAVEIKNDGSKGNLFTIVWPTKEGVENGAFPVVARKEMPDDLIKAGIAPQPKGTQKDVKHKAVDEDALKIALKNIDDMIGLDSAKNDIRQNIAIAEANRLKEELGITAKSISRHMVFTGNPGTGKTTFAREVAKVYHALGFIDKPEVHEVKREDLVAGFVGQTALKTKEAIEKAKGGILFIDEAYALSREAGASDSKDFGREAIDTLVAAMENMRDNLVVIVAGYTEPMKKFIDSNPGLKSRFTTYINFEDYTIPQLADIMDFMLQDRGYKMTADARDRAIEILKDEKERAVREGGSSTLRQIAEFLVEDKSSPLSDAMREHVTSLLRPVEEGEKRNVFGEKKQLMQVIELVMRHQRYSMSPEMQLHAMNLLREGEKAMVDDGRDFGNGRTVRNLVEKAEKEVALRLQKAGKLRPKTDAEREELRTLLTTITLEDVNSISLEALSAKKDPGLPFFREEPGGGLTMTFGGTSKKKPDNDNPNPAVFDPLPSAKRAGAQPKP